MDEFLIGDTIFITWINSGVVPSQINYSVKDGSNPEVGVDSGSMVDSGNGHYYALHTVPDTPGLYVAETLAVVSTKPFKRRIPYRAILGEVD